MPSGRVFAAALIAAALTPAAGQASANPPFPHSYGGTISGTLDARDTSQGTTTKASWTISGVRLRLARVIKTDASWQATYVVRAGRLSYHEAETGSCSYSFDTTLPLRTSLSKVSSPFALSQSLFFNHRTTALGSMLAKRGVKVSETCPQPDGEPAQVSTRTIQLPTLFDPGERRVKLGRRFAAHNSSRDSANGNTSTIKWSWVLKPAR
jgi:hypothetical protein